MGIELQKLKKIKSKIFLKFFHFLHSSHNLPVKYSSPDLLRLPAITGYRYTSTSRNSYHKAFVFPGSADFCNATQNVCSDATIRRIEKVSFYEVFYLKRWFLKIIMCLNTRVLTNSLSFFKSRYSQKWKTIFQYIIEKSNLSVGTDNNTGFSLPKVLQTTTI